MTTSDIRKRILKIEEGLLIHTDPERIAFFKRELEKLRARLPVKNKPRR